MSHKLQIETTRGTILLEDLGEPMNSEFGALHREALGVIDWARHERVTLAFMDQHLDYAKHDSYFNNLTVLWRFMLEERKFGDASRLWLDRVGTALKWESQHPGKRIHKGTPFYFLGVTQVLAGNLERGFLSIHRALDEDIRTHNSPTPDTPAYAFVTLNATKANQFFRPWVHNLADYVQSKLLDFQKSHQGNLSYALLRKRFLANPSLREEAFYFVASMAHAREFEKGDSRVEAESDFGTMLEARLLFDICLVCDRLIGSKSPPEKWGFRDRLIILTKCLKIRPNIKDDLSNLNREAQRPGMFGGTMKEVLDGEYVAVHGKPFDNIERDLALVYLFRNHGAHVLESVPEIHERFPEILDRVLSPVFFSVERILL